MTIFYLDSGGAATNSGTTDDNTAPLSGSANATILANKTFGILDVDATNNLVTVVGHGYSTAMACLLSTSSALPGGLSVSVLYFLRSLSVDTLAFYLTPADANADTNRVDITSVGAGTQTINNRTVQLGGSPDLSSIAAIHSRVTTSGTSHVITFDSAHGITTGDAVYYAGTQAPSGAALTVTYFANALSSTTARIYTTAALANAGGASNVNITATNNNSQWLVCKDRVQSQTIYLDSATNSNRKNFRILYADNTNDWVILDNTATGLGAGSNWAIGGRISASGVVDLFNVFSSNDIIIFNTDISGAINAIPRNPSPFNNGLPMILRGKAGARRVFANTGNGALFTTPNQTGNVHLFENLELQSQGTGGVLVAGAIGNQWALVNCRITDSGAHGIAGASGGQHIVIDTEITGCATDGINSPPSVSGSIYLAGCYIHDNGSDGVEAGGMTLICIDTIIERNTGDGVRGNTSTNAFSVAIFSHSTIYRNGGNGYTIQDTATNNNWNIFRDSIFKDNGNVSTEANVRWSYNQPFIFSTRNVYSIDGGLGGSNLLAGSLAATSTDLTSDPLFVDPDDASAANRDFSLQAGSPALDMSYAFPGSGTTSHRDSGAAQSDAGTGGGMLQANKRGNMQ